MSRRTYLYLFILITLVYFLSALSLTLNNRDLATENKFLKEDRIIIYRVDNVGSEMVGTVTDKEIIQGRHTVTAGAYGKFLVTEEQYNEITVGDDIPDYLKGRRN
ncbi:DUF1372 family protein [Streptococcus pluranimalium]|nr:DUF1372 family protein [Streptococcus suis]